MFTDHDGTQKPAYPACYEALNYGVEAEEETSFEKSNWWLSSADEMNTLMKDVTVGISGLETDDMNKGIADALGFRISATDNMWTSTERSSRSSWACYGSSGTLSSHGKSYSARVRSVSAFPLLFS